VQDGYITHRDWLAADCDGDMTFYSDTVAALNFLEASRISLTALKPFMLACMQESILGPTNWIPRQLRTVYRDLPIIAHTSNFQWFKELINYYCSSSHCQTYLLQSTMSNISTLNYPRTGKRGVPQQFPRRLYEMLESEAKLAESKPDETFVISWSDSGKAFRITDVEDFAATVLPRYFRTKKFSSFQRNLNLVSLLSHACLV
jgi:hypothetical protein